MPGSFLPTSANVVSRGKRIEHVPRPFRSQTVRHVDTRDKDLLTLLTDTHTGLKLYYQHSKVKRPSLTCMNDTTCTLIRRE